MWLPWFVYDTDIPSGNIAMVKNQFLQDWGIRQGLNGKSQNPQVPTMIKDIGQHHNLKR
jgi:hypothetical protein